VTAFQVSHHQALSAKVARMPASIFSQVKPRQSHHSSHPKTVINRQLQSQKRGLRIALTRADSNYRVRKSRALKKLYEGKEWNTLPDVTKNARQESVLEKLAFERDAKKEQLELKWLAKHEANEIAEDEDDGWIEKGGQNEEFNFDDDDGRGTEDAMMLDEEEEEWDGIQSDDNNNDAVDSDPIDYIESFVRDVAEIKKKSGECWMEMMTRIEEKAMKKAQKPEE